MYDKARNFQNSKFWKFGEKLNSLLLMFFGVAATAVIFGAVVSRYVLHKDLYGNEEIILLIAWWLYFIGAMNGSMEDSQIKAEMMDIFVQNHKVLMKIKAVAKFIEGIVFAASAVLSANLVKLNMIKMPKTTALKIPFTAAQIPIVIGFVFMSFYAFYYALLFISDRRTEEEVKKEEEAK